MEAQLNELKATYGQLCDSSTQQLHQLEEQLAKEEERKVDWLAGWAKTGEGGEVKIYDQMYSAYASLKTYNCEGKMLF